MRHILLGAAIAAASLSFIAVANAQGGPRIILFQEDNFRGNSIEITGQVDRIKTMRFDDRVSSVRVLSGTWLLCADDVFKGECITVRGDIPKLDRMGFDDKLSSLRPVGNDRRDRYDDRRYDDRRYDRDDRRDDRRRDR
jgi:hypothetical protein